MSTHHQSLCAGKPLQNGLDSTTAASPLQQPGATISSQVGFTAKEATDMHKDAAAMPRVTAYLLGLPNELLDIIAVYLCGSKSILDFSCANKRSRRVAQYAMLRKLCIPRNGFRQVIEKLAVDPDAALKVCHLDLGKCGQDQNNHDQAQLVAVLPSLKELTIWLSPHGDAFQARPLIRSPNHQHNSIVPVKGLALNILQERVQMLTIESDPKYKQGTAHTIKLPGFRNLRSLTVSMEHLGIPNKISFYRPDGSWVGASQANSGKHTCLPLSLKSLHLTLCTRHTFALLYAFDHLDPGELHVRYITLAFNMPAAPAMVFCLASQKSLEPFYKKASRWLRRLTNLAHKRHDVVFLTTGSSSVVEELEAITSLSNSEIALIAGEGLRFIDCVARSQEGFRARSPIEHKLFLLHGTSYLQLFCSPTFDFTQWIRVVLFHGERGARYNPRGMAETTSKLRSVTYQSPSLDFSFRATPQQTPSSQPGTAIVAASETMVSLLVPSKSRADRRGRCRREVVQVPASPTLIFNGKATELSTTPSDLRSKFVASNFMDENWTWYLLPRVPPEAAGRGRLKRVQRKKTARTMPVDEDTVIEINSTDPP